jgi:hypothetical protein
VLISAIYFVVDLLLANVKCRGLLTDGEHGWIHAAFPFLKCSWLKGIAIFLHNVFLLSLDAIFVLVFGLLYLRQERGSCTARPSGCGLHSS